jgi:hypothetical protein
MRKRVIIAALVGVAACSPSAQDGNPRDRVGDVAGKATWGVVRQGDGLAAFLARPGTAPDLVVWCRSNQEISLRAHVFQAPSANPDLSLTTSSGSLTFDNVRRQGGVRKGDRILVEGFATLTDPKVGQTLKLLNSFRLTSGSETYQAENADPNAVVGTFVAACQALPAPSGQGAKKEAQ